MRVLLLSASFVLACTSAGSKSRIGDSAIGPDDEFGGTYQELRCGTTSVCALTAANEVVCWAEDESDSPYAGPLPADRVYDLDLTRELCLLAGDGRLTCGSSSNVIFTDGITHFEVGDWSEVCAVTREGVLRCPTLRCSGVEAPSELGFAKAFLANDDYACAQGNDGTLVCWGYGTGAICEDDGAVCTCDPSEPVVLPGRYKFLARGEAACAIDVDGAISCPFGPEATPPSGEFTYVDTHLLACGVRTSGAGECWTTRDRPDLEEVPSGPLTQICSGIYGVCGLHEDGTVSCTGPASSFKRLTF